VVLIGLALPFMLVGAAPQDNPAVEVENLRHGLVTCYRDTGNSNPVEIVRLEPTIALALKAGEASDPRLSAAGGTIGWDGYLNVLRSGKFRFSALMCGKFRLMLDGIEVIAAEVRGEGSTLQAGPEVQLEAGVHSLHADLTRRAGSARVELFWQSAHFRTEPLPHDHLFHLPGRVPAKLATDQLVERGRFLTEENNCARCHQPRDEDRIAKGLATRQGPDLSQVGGRLYAGWIYRWLGDPKALMPGAVMPQLFEYDEIGRVERYAITRYLASLGGPLLPEAPAPEPKELKASIQRGERLFLGVGCLVCHQQQKPIVGKAGKQPSSYGRLYSTGSPAHVSLANMSHRTSPEKLAAYLANPLVVDPSGRMPHMLLQGSEAIDLARYLCQAPRPEDLPPPPDKEHLLAAFTRVDSRPEELSTFRRLSVDAQWTNLGKRLVIDKGCNNCHTISPGGKTFSNMLATASFDDITKPGARSAGCLAEAKGKRGRAPWFGFEEEDREALRVFLREGTIGAGSPAPTHTARVSLQRFNCLACHSRDGEGGLTAELVHGLRRVERADNGEAVSPPPLTGVGHKLRTPWLKQVLTQTGRARPWMGLRMPQFGESNVGRLPEGLAALDGADPDDNVHQVPLTAAKVTAGRQLVGKIAFGCIACHDIAGIPNSGTRGPDLALMNQRVRFDWYRRWLEQAQRMQPGTRMPTVFTDGKSLMTNILDGRADAQAEAMWAYLSLGKDLPLPEGLEPPKGLILTVKDRPVLLRTFMPDASPHSVAVGYPGNVAVVFDAADCRLAYAWSGHFLDASPTWTNRGGARAKPLGPTFWTAPPGCPWAVTASSEPPDFASRAKDPAYGAPLPEGQVYLGPSRLRFDGYVMDKAGWPTFRYRVQKGEDAALEVSERLEPLTSSLSAGLARRFTLNVPARAMPWFCAGQTPHTPWILDGGGTPLPLDLKQGRGEEYAAGRLLVLPQDGDRVTVLQLATALPGAYWDLQRTGSNWQALLRLSAVPEARKIELTVKLWAVPRGEPSLLRELVPIK
jgi:mono/diheme cytochrome c family protein